MSSVTLTKENAHCYHNMQQRKDEFFSEFNFEMNINAEN